MQARGAFLHKTQVPLDTCLPRWRLHTPAHLESLHMRSGTGPDYSLTAQLPARLGAAYLSPAYKWTGQHLQGWKLHGPAQPENPHMRPGTESNCRLTTQSLATLQATCPCTPSFPQYNTCQVGSCMAQHGPHPVRVGVHSRVLGLAADGGWVQDKL